MADDEEHVMTEEEDRAYQEALELNRQLKAALEATEAGDEAAMMAALNIPMDDGGGAGAGGGVGGGARMGSGRGSAGAGGGRRPPRGGGGGRPRKMPPIARGGGGGGSTRTRSDGGGLVTGPKPVIRRREKENYTFGSGKLADIGRGNQRLLKNLHSIASEKPRVGPRAGGGSSASISKGSRPKHRSSAAINRSRANASIAASNAQFLRRLQNVKGTMPRGPHSKSAKPQRKARSMRSSAPEGSRSFRDRRTSKPKPRPKPEWVD